MADFWRKYQKLRLKKYRRMWRLFLVEGVRLCEEALNSGWEIEAAYLTHQFLTQPRAEVFQKMLQNRGIKALEVDSDIFERLSQTETPQGILLIMKMPRLDLESILQGNGKRLVLVLDAISDPGNMGTLIRTADWFGADAVISSSQSVDLYNPKVVRASMGSIFHLDCIEEESIQKTLGLLKKTGFRILSTSAKQGQPLSEVQIQPPVALILGSEAHGLPQELKNAADMTLHIPKFGQAESLNVTVAGGILLNRLAEIIFRG
ncbi:MAG: RNA methyltransferase [Calditrichia bacterium]